MNELKIKVISEPSEENPFVVIYKPHNLPSAPLEENDTDNALYQVLSLYPEVAEVKGRKEIEKGLVHRLDTVTSGLMLVATNQNFYDGILKIQEENLFEKTYRAKCDICKDNASLLGGFPVQAFDFREGVKRIEAESFFRGYGQGMKETRPVTDASGMAALKKLKRKILYKTEINILSCDEGKAQVLCTITRGYRHQVRCHLAWAGLPIQNDKVYNYNSRDTEEDICFEASGLSFTHPLSGKIVSYSVD